MAQSHVCKIVLSSIYEHCCLGCTMIKFTKPRVHSPEHEGIEKYQKEGLSEAQNECGFGMIPGSGLRDGQVSS